MMYYGTTLWLAKMATEVMYEISLSDAHLDILSGTTNW